MKRVLLFSLLAGMACNVTAQNTNCSGATQVCNDGSITGNNGGYGIQELGSGNRGCLNGNEHQSSWFYFQPVTSGTVALAIGTAVDYDFAIWATGHCASLGTPVRCSYSATTGTTGLAAMNLGTPSGCGFFGGSPCPPSAVTDITEGASGDRFVMPLNVTAGQTYIMLIDNYTANSTPFTLNWTFTAGATLNCNPIPLGVGLISFAGMKMPENYNVLRWETATEQSSDYFLLERSSDGISWTMISKQEASGDSDVEQHYVFQDFDPVRNKINYYRLSQVDFNGAKTVFNEIVSIDNRSDSKEIVKILNTMGETVNLETKGLVILCYTDGTTERMLK